MTGRSLGLGRQQTRLQYRVGTLKIGVSRLKPTRISLHHSVAPFGGNTAEKADKKAGRMSGFERFRAKAVS